MIIVPAVSDADAASPLPRLHHGQALPADDRRSRASGSLSQTMNRARGAGEQPAPFSIFERSTVHARVDAGRRIRRLGARQHSFGDPRGSGLGHADRQERSFRVRLFQTRRHVRQGGAGRRPSPLPANRQTGGRVPAGDDPVDRPRAQARGHRPRQLRRGYPRDRARG